MGFLLHRGRRQVESHRDDVSVQTRVSVCACVLSIMEPGVGPRRAAVSHRTASHTLTHTHKASFVKPKHCRVISFLCVSKIVTCKHRATLFLTYQRKSRNNTLVSVTYTQT